MMINNNDDNIDLGHEHGVDNYNKASSTLHCATIWLSPTVMKVLNTNFSENF